MYFIFICFFISLQEREKNLNNDIPSVLNGVLYNNEYGHQNPPMVKATSSASSSSSESQNDPMTPSISQNILNLTESSENQELFPGNHGIHGINSVTKGSVNPSCQMNHISQVYQNFPRNLSSRYSVKSSSSCQSNSSSDCSCSVYDNVGSNSANYERIAQLRNGQNLKFHCHKLYPTALMGTKAQALCLANPKYLKECFEMKEVPCTDKQISSDFEKSLIGAVSSNRIPLPSNLQHLSARTIAGLYAVGLYHDFLPTDVANCDPNSLAFTSGVKHPSHLFDSPHDSVFEVYHPFDVIRRRSAASVYSANDVIFDPASAFFSVPPSFIGMRPLRYDISLNCIFFL